MKHAFGASTDGMYLHTKSDGKPFNVSKLKAKTKVWNVLTGGLFSDDTAFAIQIKDHLQDHPRTAAPKLARLWSHRKFEKESYVMTQDVEDYPAMNIIWRLSTSLCTSGQQLRKHSCTAE